MVVERTPSTNYCVGQVMVKVSGRTQVKPVQHSGTYWYIYRIVHILSEILRWLDEQSHFYLHTANNSRRDTL